MADVDSTVGTIGGQQWSTRRSSSPQSRFVPALLLLVLVTLLTRASEFFNPTTQVDEQFYLFVGRAIVHGQLPYVDVWDRKPVGLFLIYAAAAATGRASVLVYHLAAAAAALAAAILIVVLGRRIAPIRGGLCAAIAYLLLLPTMGGVGGQAPVFYNPMMAAAALLAFDAFVLAKPLQLRALGAMALCGLAIQVKPTCIFEGCFFGLLFLAAEWRESHRALGVLRLAGAMIFVALAPTATAFIVYTQLGHFHEIWTATVVSIFTKAPLPLHDRTFRLPQFLLFLGMPALATVVSVRSELRRGMTDQNLFVAGWLFAALLGFLSVPNFFDHYALPLMVPMTVGLAPLFARQRHGMLWFVAVIAIPVVFSSNAPFNIGRGNPNFDAAVRETRKDLRGGCLYVYNGPTALYTATDACYLTPFVFPDHLETHVEATALPVSPTAEVERIFSKRPAVVATEPREVLARNNATAAIVERHLACDYRLAAQFESHPRRKLSIWTLRPGGPHVCPQTHPPLGIVQSDGREG